MGTPNSPKDRPKCDSIFSLSYDWVLTWKEVSPIIYTYLANLKHRLSVWQQRNLNSNTIVLLQLQGHAGVPVELSVNHYLTVLSIFCLLDQPLVLCLHNSLYGVSSQLQYYLMSTKLIILFGLAYFVIFSSQELSAFLQKIYSMLANWNLTS